MVLVQVVEEVLVRLELLVVLMVKVGMVGLALHLIQLGHLQLLLVHQEIMLAVVEVVVGVVLLILQVAQEEQEVAVQVLLVQEALLTELMELQTQVAGVAV
jgi:hypothetical protein